MASKEMSKTNQANKVNDANKVEGSVIQKEKEKEKEKAKLLWHTIYMDGPVAGLMLLGSELVWITTCEGKWGGWRLWTDDAKDLPCCQGKSDEISGSCTKCKVIAETKQRYYRGTRSFKMYQLEESNLRKILSQHETFRKEVGMIREHDPNLFGPLVCKTGIVKSSFYDVDLTKAILIGEINSNEIEWYSLPKRTASTTKEEILGIL